jgi:hypothetical protein
MVMPHMSAKCATRECPSSSTTVLNAISRSADAVDKTDSENANQREQ